MDAIFNSPHLWLALLAMTLLSALSLRARAARLGQHHPELAPGLRALVLGQFVVLAIPWIVMGVGLELGKVPAIWHYLRLRDGNPYVLAFWASIVALWIAGIVWIFFLRGGEFLARHAAVFRSAPTSPSGVKLLYAICVGCGCVAIIVLCFVDVPLPFAGK